MYSFSDKFYRIPEPTKLFQYLFQQSACQFRIGLAAGFFHDLPHKHTQQSLLARTVFGDFVGVKIHDLRYHFFQQVGVALLDEFKILRQFAWGTIWLIDHLGKYLLCGGGVAYRTGIDELNEPSQRLGGDGKAVSTRFAV